jgi:hypothetical protein
MSVFIKSNNVSVMFYREFVYYYYIYFFIIVCLFVCLFFLFFFCCFFLDATHIYGNSSFHLYSNGILY